jgi:hypothetical protein
MGRRGVTVIPQFYLGHLSSGLKYSCRMKAIVLWWADMFLFFLVQFYQVPFVLDPRASA